MAQHVTPRCLNHGLLSLCHQSLPGFKCIFWTTCIPGKNGKYKFGLEKGSTTFIICLCILQSSEFFQRIPWSDPPPISACRAINEGKPVQCGEIRGLHAWNFTLFYTWTAIKESYFGLFLFFSSKQNKAIYRMGEGTGCSKIINQSYTKTHQLKPDTAL